MTDPSTNPGSVPPPGWYRDPAGPGRQRWWDGLKWSNLVRMESSAPVASHGSAAPSVTAGASSTPVAHGGFRPIQRPAPFVPSAPVGRVAVPVPTTVDGVVLASIGRRLVATVIDNVLVAILVFGLMPLLVGDFQARYWGALWAWSEATVNANGQAVAMSDDLVHLSALVGYYLIGATLIYGFVALLFWSRTVGQRALGIAVSPVDKGKDKVGWAPALSRSLAWTVLSQGGGLFLIVNAFSLSMILWHPKRQTLPDLLARTQVVRRG